MNGQQQGGYPPQGGDPQQGGYPPQQGGYPPQQQGGYPPQQGYPAGGPPQRSSAPKVMGILMIIFAGLGLILTLVRFAPTVPSGLADEFVSSLKTYGTITSVLALLIGIVHLVAGVFAVTYKPKAPMLATVYGAGAILVNILGLVLYYVMIVPKMKDLGGDAGAAVGALFGAMLWVGLIVGSIWPILVLILMNTKGAKAACAGQ